MFIFCSLEMSTRSNAINDDPEVGAFKVRFLKFLPLAKFNIQ